MLSVIKNTYFTRFATNANSLKNKDNFLVKAGEVFKIEYAYQVGNYCLVKLPQALGNVGRIGYFLRKHIDVEITEIRGVWLTNVDSDILHSHNNIKQGLQRLKNFGFNTIYPVVWQRGFTLYESAIAQSFSGSCITPDRNFRNRDMVAEVIAEAKSHDFRVIPWFEYGLMAPPNSPLAQNNQSLLALDSRGKQIRLKSHASNQPDEQVWLNPCQPKVQKFIVDLIAEFVYKYSEIDGIQLDDHFGFPVELGYDLFTQNLYQQENRGIKAPQNHAEKYWVDWAASKVTQLLEQIFDAIKAIQPDCFISISPNPQEFSKKYYSIDWKSWQQSGLVAEIVLQVYRSNLHAFVNEISKQQVVEACQHIPVSIGILAGVKTRSVDLNSIKQQIWQTRNQKFAGVCFFFYETIFNEKLAPTIISRNLVKPLDLFG